jgi:hypothetical protein
MCFYIDSDNCNILKAEVDIKVYKKFEIKADEGLHLIGAYQGYAYVEKYYYKLNKKNRPSITLGWRAGRKVRFDSLTYGVLHSYTESFKSYPSRDEFTLECYIPKGALYLKNEAKQEIVSTALFVTNKCLQYNDSSYMRSLFKKFNIK